MSQLLDGKTLAEGILQDVQQQAKHLIRHRLQPHLAVLVATNDEAARYYVRLIQKTATKVGVKVDIVDMPASSTQTHLAQQLSELAEDTQVHGIILQTPLPAAVNADELRSLIPPAKDVDGANPLSAGRLVSGLEAFSPATPEAIMEILEYYKIPISGQHAVVIGRSRVVGKPLAHLLLAKDATVTICHSRSTTVKSLASQADILIAAAGRPGLVTGDFVKEGATVVDVGTTVDTNGRLQGDVEATSVSQKAGGLTPVPGGVGPVTTATVLKHTIEAASTSLKGTS